MRQFTTFRLYLLGLALLFAVFVLVESHRPKPLDWTPSYINTDKIPYGTYALFDQLPRLLGTDSVEVVRLPAYNQLTGISLDDTPTDSDEMTFAAESMLDTVGTVTTTRDSAGTTTTTVTAVTENSDEEESPETTELPLLPLRATYLFINNEFGRSKLDEQALLAFVRQGNDVFITADNLNGAFTADNMNGGFLDSLGISMEEADLPTHPGPSGLPVPDSVTLQFTNPALARERYRLPGGAAGQRFIIGPRRQGRTLATDPQGRAVYVELAHGRGHFYLCAVPAAFSNYYFLRPRTQGFAAAALRYLPARRTYWDEYQKQGPAGQQSLLRVLMAHEGLRLAYYLVLAGTLLFVFTGARRRQRVIPIINPLPNTTLLFTRTVAGLYRQGSNHALIAEKKTGLFLDYLRTRFQENQPDFADEAFRERLSQKAGLPRARIDALLRLINFARTAPQVSDQQLLQLTKAIADFRREAD